MKYKINEIFEEYLRETHADQYIGLDDDMPDDYNDWIDQLDVQEVIDYANNCIEKNCILKKEINK